MTSANSSRTIQSKLLRDLFMQRKLKNHSKQGPSRLFHSKQGPSRREATWIGKRYLSYP